MQLHIPDPLIRSILAHETLAPEQIRSIARTAYLAAEIDFEDGAAEEATLGEAASRLWQVAGLPAEPIAPVSPLPLDDEERRARIRELAAGLTSRGSREVAYAVAYLLAAADVELAPAEARFLADLQRTLAIDDERAAALVAMAARAVTPGLDGDGES